ncbi:hypothetical protein RA27_10250 [Ruegeria sp. ANG-R]|uniref:hypothetical protein n=1 Tax=Ruegeria sp. ANG-R TaxID=1577903 RepID=UPI0005806B2F|nr:hypothetical protein [Ruegeria sp. ANG-R]KIC41605.1 hypothetical protein RA27_10250 [Ruegeria sp. ANG-R]
MIAFFLCRGRTVEITLIVTVLGGYLFLPTGRAVDLPLFYELNKHTVAAYMALLLCCLAVLRNQNQRGRGQQQVTTWLPGWLPVAAVPRILVTLLLFGVVMTVLTNRDPIVETDVYNWRRQLFGGTVVIPGVPITDIAAQTLQALVLIIPLILGRKFLAHPDAQRLLLLCFCIGALLYVPLVLFEVRMSPQINRSLYGYFPHSWVQHVRSSGFRPIVFLGHGLQVSIFLSAALLLTLGLARINTGKIRVRFLMAGAAIFIALVASKSLGALMIALFFFPIILFAPRRILIYAAAGLAIVVTIYPLLRGLGLVPLDEILTLVEKISAQRAASLEFRLNTEELLLARAEERPFFGWGTWGRNLYIGGGNYAVVDGQWVIALSVYGWAGFLARFGLLIFPVILLLWRWRRDEIGMESIVIGCVLTASVIDLIPNSGLTPDKLLMAGALWGRLELGRITETDEKFAVDPAPVRLGYRRSGPMTAASGASMPEAASTTKVAEPLSKYTRQTRRMERRSASRHIHGFDG